MKKRASLFTLGCRLNQYETEALRDRLCAGGYEIVEWGKPAELAIINTCAVTQLAEAKCRQIIRGFVKANPRGFCVVAGCYPQINTPALAKIPGVDLIVGNAEKLNILDYVSLGKKNPTPLIVCGKISKEDFSIPLIGSTTFDNRANLKIQDGCDFMCSFCAIPLARGRSRSRDIDNLLSEAKSFVERGARELILTGINVGTYTSKGNDIVSVIDKIAQIPGLDRIRIGSIEPKTIPDGIAERMSDPTHPLMPFLHLPLQSGSKRILREMRRHYTLEEYKTFAEQICKDVPDLCLGTDLMIGFPGETDEEFDETCKVFIELPFAYCHVFTYSERKGTSAASRPDAVPIPIRQRRSIALRALSAKKRHTFMEKYLGRELDVLFENPGENAFSGYTENYLRVKVPKDAFQKKESPANQIRKVRVLKIAGDTFLGEPV